ncbi:hypothetical protein DIE23_07225 [Burkholderia sp. Bp9143]|uniref:hypothetical protein n=1 Tax=Burkholderia sp. Bp9143 TaxID=2184574 RepID=UPI000F5A5B36|nr:hypothetical protein [Burkholderia sp. Bp9143]RQR36491.1 hypothetical protein DIE23_07225 [Burkholderia sp. Bp9143]
MDARLRSLPRAGSALLLAASLALLVACGGDGGGGSGAAAPSVSMSGTAATGRALANATISITCVLGSSSTTTDAGGNYHATLGARLPCLITATSGSTVLHSIAFAGGTFNVTPETDLLLAYMAAQLGTTEGSLIVSFTANAQFQLALGNPIDVLNAQTAVGQALDQRFALTLAVPNFLTTPFAVGQPGVDTDLTALAHAGAIDSNGEPDPVATALMATVGAQHPLPVLPAPPTGGGPGGTGTGSGGGMM